MLKNIRLCKRNLIACLNLPSQFTMIKNSVKLFECTAFSTVLLIISFSHVVGNEHVVDVAYPIVLTKRSEQNLNNLPESYFGYTVSLAPGIGQDKTSQDPDGWIFVGAPKANASAGMYNSPNFEPGVIWRCSLGRTSSVGDNCQKVNLDPVLAGNRPRPNSPAIESHDEAMIGISMQINLGHFLTCGIKWNRGRNQFYNGICYWFPDNPKLSYRSNDLANLIDKKTYAHRLVPFFKPDPKTDKYGQSDTTFAFVDSSNQNTSGHEWQLSQAGMSVHLFHDGDAASSIPNLLIGAPGVREWSGAVVLYTNPTSPRPDLERRNRNEKDNTFSEYVVGNRGKIPNNQTVRQNHHWNDYFGFSVTSGKYLKPNELLYAAGAPRAEHTGQVVIFKFPPYEKPSSTYKRQVETVLELNPPENAFASYFGAVVLSLDLNEDGLDELIVGAPLYTLSSTSKDSVEFEFSNEAGDHGCVFIYKFKDESTRSTSVQPMYQLVGSKSSSARFGSAISPLVFNLQNSKKEIYIVVGAPYEVSEDDSSSGAIYLYLYNNQTGTFGTYTQRIIASSISKALKGFGCSISLPADIDLNETPDLAIGSYKSDQAVILRTRPKISLMGWMKFLSTDLNEIEEIRRGVPRFIIRSCFNVTEMLGLISRKLDIWVKVKFTDPTIKFDESDPNRVSNNEVFYRADAFTKNNCKPFTIHAVHEKGIGMDDSDFLMEIKHPFHFVQEIWYNDTLNHQLSVLNYDVVESTRQKRQNGVDFQSFNPRKPSPQLNKIIQDLPISLTDCRDALHCAPDIKTTWTFLNEKGQKISQFNLGQKQIHVQIVVQNFNETAAQPVFTIDWSNLDIKESPSGSRWLHRTCNNTSNTKTRSYKCLLGQYIKNGRNVTIDIQLTMEDIFLSSPNDFTFTIAGSVSFKDSKLERFPSKGSLLIAVPSTIVSMTGSRENHTFNTPTQFLVSKHTTDNSLKSEEKQVTLYSPFRQRFTIEIKGGFVKKLNAQFKIPVIQDGFDLRKPTQLILIKYNAVTGVTCKSSSPRFGFHKIELAFNPDGVGVVTSGGNERHQTNFISDEDFDFQMTYRRKREVEDEIIPDQIAIDRMETEVKPKIHEKMQILKDALILSCNESETNCIDIQCTAENIRTRRPLHIPFELYLVKNAVDKLLEEKGKTSLFVESMGFVDIFNGEPNHKSSDVAQTAMVMIPVKMVETWVYFVAGISGIVLLILIVLGLYKCGFFKREKRQQLNHMKAEHHRKSMIAAARSSIIQSAISTGDGGVSLEELTEAEHHNEDKELEQVQEDDK